MSLQTRNLLTYMDCHRKGVPLRCGHLREGTLYVLGIEWEGGDRYLPQHCSSVGTGELARRGARATQREERKRTEEGPGSPGLSLPVSDSMVSLTQQSLSVANPGRGSRGPDAEGDPVSNCV